MKTILLVLFLEFLAGTLCQDVSDVIQCPNGWTLNSADTDNGQKSVFCQRLFTDKMEYERAVTVCAKAAREVQVLHGDDSLMGHVPEIRESWHQKAVMNIMGGNMKIFLATVWSASMPIWRYRDVPVYAGYTNWLYHATKRSEVAGESCVVFGRGGKWLHEICDDKLPFLCLVNMNELYAEKLAASGRKKRSGLCDLGCMGWP